MFGAPKFLRTDNGSEFIAKTLVRWLKDQDVQSRFIDPGSPLQNGRNERFNGTLRHEFLNQGRSILEPSFRRGTFCFC